MAITYENVFYDFALDPLRDLFITEYAYGNIYIAPEITQQVPFSIRIWSDSAETVQEDVTAWIKQYNIEIALYEIEANPGEEFYKQFFNDIERIYQLLFDNANTNSTTLSGGSGSNTSSVAYTWFDGNCEIFTINDFTEAEAAIDGLNVCKFTFNCKLTRVS
tara:strand:- start:359 stop:844 length:486 start_codon:yes stop_codon:yes gene_type:complete